MSGFSGADHYIILNNHFKTKQSPKMLSEKWKWGVYLRLHIALKPHVTQTWKYYGIPE